MVGGVAANQKMSLVGDREMASWSCRSRGGGARESYDVRAAEASLEAKVEAGFEIPDFREHPHQFRSSSGNQIGECCKTEQVILQLDCFCLIQNRHGEEPKGDEAIPE